MRSIALAVDGGVLLGHRAWYSRTSCAHALRFFPHLHTLSIHMPDLGVEELAALGQAGPAVARVRRLMLCGDLESSFWEPSAHAVLSGVQELDLSSTWQISCPAPVQAIVDCCAAMRSLTIIRGMGMRSAGDQAALEAQLTQLPGRKMQLVPAYRWTDGEAAWRVRQSYRGISSLFTDLLAPEPSGPPPQPARPKPTKPQAPKPKAPWRCGSSVCKHISKPTVR